MRKWVNLCLILAVCFCFVGCKSVEQREAEKRFEAAKVTLDEKNVELETLISNTEELLLKNEAALDETIKPSLKTAISNAKSQKIDAPDMPKTLEEINGATDKLNSVDYGDVLSDIFTKKSDLERSIKQYALVNAPSEAYVIQSLKNIPTVVDISAVTEDNDPNGKLNKPGGYTAHIYFSSSLVNQASVSGGTVIEKGTNCGGSIEVYGTVKDAQSRDNYLAAFDGGVFSSGSHKVVGTVIVRTSDKLTASQQKTLESNIIESLTAIE